MCNFPPPLIEIGTNDPPKSGGGRGRGSNHPPAPCFLRPCFAITRASKKKHGWEIKASKRWWVIDICYLFYTYKELILKVPYKIANIANWSLRYFIFGLFWFGLHAANEIELCVFMSAQPFYNSVDSMAYKDGKNSWHTFCHTKVKRRIEKCCWFCSKMKHHYPGMPIISKKACWH